MFHVKQIWEEVFHVKHSVRISANIYGIVLTDSRNILTGEFPHQQNCCQAQGYQQNQAGKTAAAQPFSQSLDLLFLGNGSFPGSWLFAAGNKGMPGKMDGGSRLHRIAIHHRKTICAKYMIVHSISAALQTGQRTRPLLSISFSIVHHFLYFVKGKIKFSDK